MAPVFGLLGLADAARHMQWMRMPYYASSIAASRMNPWMPAFAAE
jgi:hypothetical protein